MELRKQVKNKAHVSMGFERNTYLKQLCSLEILLLIFTLISLFSSISDPSTGKDGRVGGDGKGRVVREGPVRGREGGDAGR